MCVYRIDGCSDRYKLKRNLEMSLCNLKENIIALRVRFSKNLQITVLAVFHNNSYIFTIIYPERLTAGKIL